MSRLASTGIPHAQMVENITKVYDQANDLERSWGMAWYPLARVSVAELCPTNVRKAAGVVAALSPQKRWAQNLEIAKVSLELGEGYGSFQGQNDKATAIIQGASPVDVLGKGAFKSRAFYCAILAPLSEICTVVDRHAHDIAVGVKMSDGVDRRLDTKGVYFSIDRAYREASDNLLVPLHTLQATTWITWRARHGIVDYSYEEEW